MMLKDKFVNFVSETYQTTSWLFRFSTFNQFLFCDAKEKNPTLRKAFSLVVGAGSRLSSGFRHFVPQLINNSFPVTAKEKTPRFA
jgi:hypothetical protein